jgi:hypothetical protein
MKGQVLFGKLQRSEWSFKIEDHGQGRPPGSPHSFFVLAAPEKHAFTLKITP